MGEMSLCLPTAVHSESRFRNVLAEDRSKRENLTIFSLGVSVMTGE